MNSNPRLLDATRWAELLAGAVDTAQSTVYVLTFTVIATPAQLPIDAADPYRAIERAALRGLDVRLIRSATQRETIPSASGHAAAARLIYAGAQVRTLPPRPTLHAKAHAVDGQVLFVGSANLTRSSADANIELGARLDDPADLQQFATIFGALWETATPEPMPHPGGR